MGHFLLRVGDEFGTRVPWAHLGVLCCSSCSVAQGSPRDLRRSWDPLLYILGSRAKSLEP